MAAYDLINEPWVRPGINHAKIFAGHDALIKQVRTVAPDKVIHVEPQYGSGDLRGACGHLELLTDKRNVVLQFHSYFGGGSVDGFTNRSKSTRLNSSHVLRSRMPSSA